VTPLPSRPVALAVGDELPAWRAGPLTRTDFVRYAGAGGDFNPIHHDEPMATAAGMPSVFGMGLLHAGMLGLRLARWVGPGSIRAFAVRFTGQVWPGDELTFGGHVVAIDADGVAALELEVTRHDGDVVLRATAAAAVARDL
jgi:acyl dehydratase